MQQSHRFFLISWLLVPIVFVWLSTNYLLGLNRQVKWQAEGASEDTINVEEILAKDIERKETERIKWNGDALLTLTFDDAWSSQYLIGYPILKDMGYKGVLAVPTELVGQDNYMSWNQVKTLYSEGWEIASHTRNHSCELEKMTGDYLIKEILGSKQDLIKRGMIPQNYISPCGVDTPEIRQLAKDNYLSLRGTEGGYNTIPVDDPYNLKIHAIEWNTEPAEIETWIAEARQYKRWLIVVFHQIQEEESEYGTTLDKFKEMMDIVKNSGVQVVSMEQALHLDMGNTATRTEAVKTVEIATGTYVNIHPVKKVASETIARMTVGVKYKVIAQDADWVEIEYESGKTGFVVSRLIKEATNE